MRKLSLLMVVSCLLFAPHVSQAAIFTVDADLNSFGCGNSSPASALLDTGIDIAVGDSISITASGSWRISPSDPVTDANGQIGRSCFVGNLWCSALIGQIGDVPLRSCDAGVSADNTFLIGTNFSQVSSLTGRLFLAFSDTDSGNNEGSVSANVTVTPAPQPPVSLIIQKVTINSKTGKFVITGSMDVTDPVFEHLVKDPNFRLRLELESQGSSQDPFGIVGQDEVSLKTRKKVLMFKAH